MKNKIKELVHEIENLAIANSEELEAMRVKYLSKKGLVSELFNDFRNVANEEKREVGQLLNDLKNKAQDKINEIKESFAANQSTDQKNDLTRTADPIKVGTRHPLSLTKNEIVSIFSRIGFTIAEGPEIEDDWHVFGALNFPPEHPARDMQDTFFIEQNPDVLLRTHTSSVQSRIMANQNRRYVCCFPDVYTVTKQFRTAHTVSSIR